MTQLANCNIGALLTASGVAVAPLADISVLRESDGGVATIYSDEAGTALITQPGFKTDASGRAEFYADGIDRGYRVIVTKAGGGETWTLNHVAIGTAGQRDQDDFVLAAGSTMTAAVAMSGDLTPAQITADQNDYNPTNLSTASVLRTSTDAPRSVTGLQGGSDGRLITWVNTGSFNERLVSESGSSSAANRFSFPNGDLILRPGEIAVFIYDATSLRWRLFAGPVNADSVPLPRSYLAGLKLANNGSDATNDIDVAVGEARAWDNTENLRLASAITKQLDAAWAVGSAAGMRDTGSIADGTWHLHEIKRPDSGVVDVLASLSAEGQAVVTMTIASPCVVTWNDHGMVNGAGVIFTNSGGALPTGITAGTLYYVINRTQNTFQIAATQGGAAINTSGSQSGTHTGTISPTMPANYTRRRRSGAILREAGAIVAFVQDGDYFRRKASVLDVNTTNPGTSAVTAPLSVPTGVNVLAMVNANRTDSALGGVVLLSDLAANDEAPSQAAAPLGSFGNAGAGQQNAGNMTIRTSTMAQLRYRAISSDGNTVIHIATLGWHDRRGRDS